MDHIPCAEDFDHPEIPLSVDEHIEVSLTVSELVDFPTKCGWDVMAFMKHDFTTKTHRRSDTEIARFVQLWLYFGVLSAALGVKIKVGDFLLKSSTGSRLCAPKLNSLVQEFLDRGQSLSKAQKIAMIITLCEATKLLRNFLPSLIDGDEHCPIPLQLGHSLTVLGCSLEFAVPQMISRATVASDIREGTIRLWAEQWPLSRLLKQLFAKRGWCSNDLYRLNKLVSVDALCYAATIRRVEIVDHSRCSEQECAVNNIDVKTYCTQHLKPGCSCSYIENTIQQACNILASGAYPLICLESWKNGSTQVNLVPYRCGMRYTAIPHVWSDGLGNPKANSVAVCQLQHLSSLQESFTDTKLIWLDTLCVPLERQYRNLAIRLMAETYEKAAQVLVLDSELRQVTHTDKPIYEAFARISASGWMRRVWTMQEGVLASHLFAEFRDGVLDVSSAISNTNEETHASRFELNMVPIEFMFVIGILQSIRRSKDRKCELFVNVWNAVRLRRTSRRGDEVTCFAHLLGLPVGDILDADGNEQKMMTCLSMLDHVPLGLLFTFGPKLKIKGYRWAPLSLFQDERIDPTSTPVPRDEKGLRLMCCGIFLEHFAAFGFSGDSYYLDQGDLILKVRLADSWKREDIIPSITRSKLAIIIDGAARDSSSDLFAMVQGALVSVDKREGEWGVQCQYECGVEWGTIRKTEVTQEVIGKCIRTDQKLKWYLA